MSNNITLDEKIVIEITIPQDVFEYLGNKSKIFSDTIRLDVRNLFYYDIITDFFASLLVCSKLENEIEKIKKQSKEN